MVNCKFSSTIAERNEISASVMMADEAYSCIVCSEAINRDVCQPVSLECGHTFCRQCLIRINAHAGELKCPKCRKQHRGQRPEELPLNFALLSALEVPQHNRINNNNTTTTTTTTNDNNESGNAALTPGGNTCRKNWGFAGTLAAIVGCAIIAAGIAPALPTLPLMGVAAIANGGGVAAGGIAAILQAGGVGVAGNAALAGAAAGGLIAGNLAGPERRNGPPGNNNDDSGEDSDGPRE